ncbi:MAG: hypothetical protein GY938_18525 [Ketobacter sp.]|nr:hypothetical protein [Ketobacter sp.]
MDAPQLPQAIIIIRDDIDAIRFIVEIDAPYFVEGQSVVELRITESLGLFGKELSDEHVQVQWSNSSLGFPENSIKLSSFTQTTMASDKLSDGRYRCQKTGLILIIHSVKAESIAARNKQATLLDYTAWATSDSITL